MVVFDVYINCSNTGDVAIVLTNLILPHLASVLKSDAVAHISVLTFAITSSSESLCENTLLP